MTDATEYFVTGISHILPFAEIKHGDIIWFYIIITDEDHVFIFL